MDSSARAWLPILAIVVGCDASPSPPSRTCGPDALADCARPRQTPAYYVDQAMRYFDALDVAAPAEHTPTYAELVVRWEWPPWLKLTGYTAAQMELTDKLVKQYAPAVVSHRDCRAFDRQPFARWGETVGAYNLIDLPDGLSVFEYNKLVVFGSGVTRIQQRLILLMGGREAALPEFLLERKEEARCQCERGEPQRQHGRKRVVATEGVFADTQEHERGKPRHQQADAYGERALRQRRP